MVNRYYSGPPSDHVDGGRFFNPHHPNTDRGLLQLLQLRFGGKRAMWPATTPVRQVVPERRVDGLRITRIGHATVLVQAEGRDLLVDPVWSERASPFGFAGPKRVNAPGVAFEHLPPIDAVLLTHNHLDMATIQRLWERDRPRIIASLDAWPRAAARRSSSRLMTGVKRSRSSEASRSGVNRQPLGGAEHSRPANGL
jgi:hypothetical protein